MGIAERVYEVVKDLPELEAEEILDFVEHLDLAVFRRYRGTYDGRKIGREELHDRAGVC